MHSTHLTAPVQKYEVHAAQSHGLDMTAMMGMRGWTEADMRNRFWVGHWTADSDLDAVVRHRPR